MSTPFLSIPYPSNLIHVVVAGAETARPGFEYVDGKKTDDIRTHAEGWPIFQVSEAQASVGGVGITAKLQMGEELTIPAGSVLRPSSDVTINVRGRSSNTDFVPLMVTISARSWEIVGNAFEALTSSTAQNRFNDDGA